MINYLRKINKIKNGKTVPMSRSEMVSSIINLNDAKKNLSKSDFEKVHNLYKEIKKDKEMHNVGLFTYNVMVSHIIEDFNEIAPWDLYSGKV